MPVAAGLGWATLLGACLLALSAWVSPAQAIEIFQPLTEASLAFSPTSISTGQFVNICAVNYNAAPASVSFVFKDVDNPGNNFNSPAVIAPGARSCGPVLSMANPNAINIPVSIVLHSPNDCSQATEYPGKCRVLGSVEIFGDIEGMFVNRIHLEPGCCPGRPAARRSRLPRDNGAPRHGACA